MDSNKSSVQQHQQRMKRTKIKKRQKLKQSSANISSICNLTGLSGGGLPETCANEGDLLDELTALQQSSANTDIASVCKSSGLPQTGANEGDLLDELTALGKEASTHSIPLSPPLDQVPNIRVELARHLHTQNLSKFLLGGSSLRMPSFERWLLDSKLEETSRLEAMISKSIHNPTLLHPNDKKKYGRAARSFDSDESERTEKDRKLLRESAFAAGQRDASHADRTNFWLHHVERDPILPYHAQESDPSSVRLAQEIMAAAGNGMGEEESKKARYIVRQLCRKASEACNEICQLQERAGRFQKLAANPSKKRKRNDKRRRIDRVSVEWLNEKQLSLVYTQRKKSSAAKDCQKAKPFVVKINSSSYHKLRSMFDLVNKRQTKVSEADVITHAFHCLVFVLVIRYSTLAGAQQINGDLRGGGNQGAVNSEVFGVLSKHFGELGTECFASPFNSTSPRFFSAFPSPDVDGFFGSYGDFYHPPCEEYFQKSGWFEANPPFCPGYETQLARRICGLLDKLSKAGKEATFVVVVPTVRCGKNLAAPGSNHYNGAHDDSFAATVHGAASGSFNMLIGHECCRSHIVLKAREHGYIEGSQHLRPTQYKESLYSTSVIVLRTKMWECEMQAAEFERDLREAFASKHRLETEKRRIACDE